MAKIRVLVDVNVILDVLARRDPFFTDSAKVWYFIESGQVEGYVAAHTITTIHYLLRKHHTSQSVNNYLAGLLQVFEIAEVNKNILNQALAIGGKDFEDSVQIISATHNHCHYWITRDKQVSPDISVVSISPREFNRLLL